MELQRVLDILQGRRNFPLMELKEKTGMTFTELCQSVEYLALNGKVILSVSINTEATRMYQSRCEYLYNRFMDLVSTYFTENRNVGFYASKLCISPRYLSFVVKQICGKTPTVLIKEKVMEEIKFRLCCTQESIKEIAYGLNFPNLSFFGKYFKAETSISPSIYRAIHVKEAKAK